ncbi:hypothetical protein C5167_030744 [Papaver somniferum]|uniref:uncharacterized protein LOC113334802 isoform X1 n=1 Tax=Papaver somniferum TaxID=3469 RepID=UPI000E6F8A1D|nr:uncharacterized protein LOC113334802 isoform X1 [Papaver somniferum]XP_026436796.1 uncharacterized protein LOC113334802 isoform X1 [Papaver somniferum]XP_026436797.1 uncharacterized protein LOC113334802 isoform X1 [Papaver somniferum]XP_026436798.1 uncharacterized protein LOC113334802 isoform X1 [Papaver somniferum]RZC89051.1 hypothetical protein C5167_030744 [Papaver somniferum]
MEGFGVPGFDNVAQAVRKKRSSASRRPRPDSSTPPSDNVSKVSSDENNGYEANFRRKEFNLNTLSARVPSANKAEGETSYKRLKKDGGSFGEVDGYYKNGSYKGSSEHGRNKLDLKRCSEGVLAPANWKSTGKVEEHSQSRSDKLENDMVNGNNDERRPSDGIGNENKLRKVKLKVGGVTRTLHAKSSADGASGGEPSIKLSRSLEAPRPRPKLILQDNSDDDESPPSPKGIGLQGVRWKDFSCEGFGQVKEESSKKKMVEESEGVRKSKRPPKRRVLDGEFDDGEEDEEIRYLEKLRMSKASMDSGADCDDDEEKGSKKHRKISRVSKIRMVNEDYKDDVEYASSRSGKKKSRSDRGSDDAEYVEELVSDEDPDVKRKKLKKDTDDLVMEGKKEMTLTTRQRALQSGKDISSASGTSLIEFPNGLPPAPPRKNKEKLSEVEQQLKKAEAAQRRRLQVEKAARESEAEAVRKILGQDSSRKKREDKLKKRRDEIAQEKADNAITLPPNTIRWTSNPSGTTVTFSQEIGLPSLFSSKPISYPPPREKCAGPSCTNAYRYRDSKTKLPFCSLECYRAVQELMQ